MSKEHPKTDRELRRFGIVMAVPLSALAAFAAWRGNDLWMWFAGAAGIFQLLGLVAPSRLRGFEALWMKLALAMGHVMTFVILVVTFFLVFTPLGFLMRVFGKRPLSIGFDRSATTYWTPVEPDSPYTRVDKPY